MRDDHRHRSNPRRAEVADMIDADLDSEAERMGFDTDELREERMAKEIARRAAANEARRDLERLRQEIRAAALNQVWIANYGSNFSVIIQGVRVRKLTKDPLASFKCYSCGKRLPGRVEELLRESVEVFRNKNYVRSFSLEEVECPECEEPNEVIVQVTA